MILLYFRPYSCTIIPFTAELSTTFGQLLDCFNLDVSQEFHILEESGRNALKDAKVGKIDVIASTLCPEVIW